MPGNYKPMQPPIKKDGSELSSHNRQEAESLPNYLKNTRAARITDNSDLSYDLDKEIAEVKRMQEEKAMKEAASTLLEMYKSGL
jgi:hypothetical protein